MAEEAGVDSIKSYRDLRVWQNGMELAALAYRFTRILPAAERFGLVTQIQRAAASVPANIAEGYGRESKGSYAQFLKTSRGSVYELETHILLSAKVGHCTQEECREILAQSATISRALSNLIRSVEASGGPS